MPEMPAKSAARSESASRAARLTALKKRLAREFLDGKTMAELYADTPCNTTVQNLVRDGLFMVMRQWANEEANRIIRLYKVSQGMPKAGGPRNANVR